MEILHQRIGCTCTGKWCSTCGGTHGYLCIEAFHKFKYSPDGRRYQCKTCRAALYTSDDAKTKRRAHEHEQREQVNAAKRARYAARPEHYREIMRRYRRRQRGQRW